MSEDQKPFVHQDGTTTPPAGTPVVSELLQPTSIAALVVELERDVEFVRKMPSGEQTLDMVTEAEISRLRRTIHTLQLLQEPRINMTVGALKLLAPSMQALVSDVAIALATNTKGQQHLANALRKLIEGRS